MSSRQLRKLIGNTTLPPLEGDSDEDFEPLYSKSKTKPTFTYEGLEINSDSNSDDNENAVSSAEEVENHEEISKKKKKKKKKKKQQKPKLSSVSSVVPDCEKLDEIDRAVQEVDAALGSPAAATSGELDKQIDPVKKLLSVQSKFLNYRNEIRKMFGTENPEEEGKPKDRSHNTKYKKSMIVNMPENILFKKNGYSMSLLRKENGCSYFVFDHGREYQTMHKAFLELESTPDIITIEYRMNVHIEALLHIVDNMFRSEEYTAASKILEHIICYMQYVAHPLFNLTDRSHRLEYKYAENRPFFVAVLKHLHMLTNKSCHRTALELAKLLVSLDPSDPVAVIYIVDVLALRAREFQWLVEIVDHWNKERDAYYLFNLKYSYALAHFHLTKKNKSDNFSKADELLKHAMLAFPTITAQILAAAKHEESANVQKHPMFNNPFEEKYKTSDSVKVAMTMYAKLVASRWREPPVLKWFLRNANELMQRYNSDPSLKKDVENLVLQRASLFAVVPQEIQRHLCIIGPMVNLLVEWDGPPVRQARRPWDPLPPRGGIYRYAGYALSDNAYMPSPPFTIPYLEAIARQIERQANGGDDNNRERRAADRP